MRYAVISDIHSNLEALTACLEKIDKLKVNRILCLGDIVGYNANPNECIELLRERSVRCVMGNHDSRAAGEYEIMDFNHHAEVAILWTREVLTDENRDFLRALPDTLVVDRSLLMIHGWVNDTDSYISGARDAMVNFDLLKGARRPRLCFFGHTHVAISYIELDGSVLMHPDYDLAMNNDDRHLVNPGSVGQPRDRDPRASFVVYDTARSLVTYHRVEYDITTTTRKIIEVGLPPRLAERLKLGW